MIKWKMDDVTNYGSGGFCERDCDLLDEQVRCALNLFGSVRIVGRL